MPTAEPAQEMPVPNRRSLAVLTGLSLLSALAAGCAGSGRSGFQWVRGGGETSEARHDLKNAPQLDLSYAQWQEQLGNVPEAQQSYRRVLSQHPESVDALLGLARLEQLAGRPEEAEAAYRRAVAAAPKDAQTLDALGQFYADGNRWKEAVETLAAATAADPSNRAYRYHFAVSLARAGRHREALPEFARSVGDAEAHYNLGYVLYEQNRVAEAEQEFLQAVTLNPRLDVAQRMLDELRAGRDGATVAGGVATRGPVTQAAAVSRAPAPAGTRTPPRAAATARPQATSPVHEQVRNQRPLAPGR